ncbi:MAG: preprotein translocase subunit YajC [Deltaproteobacteria bacterium]|nr:preprotein translocase subunit YajC [Deltaproteobacteria bacterium]
MADIAYAQGGAGMGPGPLLQFLPLAMVMVIFYFLLIRPQQQKMKAHRELIDNLKRNDEVMTGGGLYGRVVELADRIVTLEVAPNVRVRVDRLHVETVVSAMPKPAKSSDKGEGKDK